jgi:hypothetical protein
MSKPLAQIINIINRKFIGFYNVQVITEEF